ncbi:MAG: DUF2075 domain-containing protein, partial [Marinoscillum sp.]
VGGGQEINTGEAGISEWLMAINNRFQNWQVFISPNLTGVEYDCEKSLKRLEENSDIHLSDNLHLSVSMRSFRAENLSELVKNILEREFTTAQKTFQNLSKNYPLVLTRNLTKAKDWLQQMARGSERYGIVVSSQAQRLKPFAIDVKTPVDPVHWFLNDKLDVRSSFYLEDVVTEFQIQGLELDWSCVVWDGDLRYSQEEWMTFGFKGDKWQKINKPERKLYLLNAYRVLLTRARQGMVIVLPEGSETDHTRKAEYYDATYEYLKEIGIPVL